MDKEYIRQRRFERAWLKRNHPEIFKQMELASAENTRKYYAKWMEKAGSYFEEKFNIRPAR